MIVTPLPNYDHTVGTQRPVKKEKENKYKLVNLEDFFLLENHGVSRGIEKSPQMGRVPFVTQIQNF